MRYRIHLGDSFAWLEAREENSIHAIVTDPPYGLKEYTEVEKAKLRNGRGGVWRIPPSFDGCKRSPLPRFTVLDEADIAALRSFFAKFAKQAMRVLVPGGHIMIATNPLLSQYVYIPLMEKGSRSAERLFVSCKPSAVEIDPRTRTKNFTTYPLCHVLVGSRGVCSESRAKAGFKTTYVSGEPGACVACLAKIRFLT